MQPLKDKILTAWQHDSLAETPQIAVKKRCVPALFQDCLLERDSLRGRVVVTLRAWFHIEDEERWKQIFQTVFSTIKESDVERFSGRKGYVLYQYLTQPPCPLNSEKLFPPTKGRAPATKEFIEQYSMLKTKGREADILGPVENLPLESLLPLAEGVFGEEVNEALATREKLKKIVADKDKEGLKNCAKAMAASIRGMEAGTTKLHFATLPTQSTHVVMHKVSHDPVLADLQEFLLENRGAEALTEQLKEKASPALQKILDNQALIRVIKGVEKSDFGRLSQSLIKGKPLWQQILLYPADWIRSQTNDMVKQMADHLYQELDERFRSVLTPPLQKELYQLIMTDEGIKAALESRVKLFLEKKLSLLKQETDKVLSTIAEKLPAVVPAYVELTGRGRLGRLEQPFWLEWKKGENGQFHLSVYITGQAILNRPLVNGEPQSVLHFTLSEGQLDEDFFIRLLSYESDPVWQDGKISYSFADVEAGLLSSLKQLRPSQSKNAHRSTGNWGILREYAEKKGIDPERNYFMAKREAMIDLWHHPNREANKRALEENALQLAKEGLKLHERGAIDDQELKRTYATCYEVLGSISALCFREKANIFPQGLKDAVRNLLSATGCSTVTLVFIKEVLSDALGPEAEKNLDALLKMVQEDLGVVNPRPSLLKLPWQMERALQVWKVARFAVGYYISPKIFVVQVVTVVAYKVFSAYFPGTLLLIHRWKRKIVIKAASLLILSKEKNEKINQVILSFRCQLTCDKELNFTYTSKATGVEKGISLAGLQKLGPDHPAEVRLAKLNLPFQVKEEQRIESVDYPGFFVAPIQKHESLTPYGNYLLLQNSKGEKKVILPFEGIRGAFVNGLLKRFDLGEAAVFDAILPKNEGKSFAYSMDEKGRLISADAEAMTHLFLYHLAKWNLPEVNFYLKALEEIGKREELPEMLPKAALALHLLALITKDQTLMMNALRLTLLFKGKTYDLPQLNMLSLFFTQANFSKYLENRKFIYPPLTPDEELTIIRAIKEEGKKFCDAAPTPIGFLDEQRQTEAFILMMESFVVFPEINQRHNELEPDSAASRAGKTAFKNIGNSLANPLVTGIESYQFRKAAENIPLNDKLIPIEELPTKFSEADPAFIYENFLSYYVLAQQFPPRDKVKRELFLTKVAELKRTLTYLQGNYVDKDSAAAIKLLHIMLTSPPLTLLPAPEQLLSDRRKGLRQLIALCENTHLALEAAGGAMSAAGQTLEEHGWQLEFILNGLPIVPVGYWAANLGWSAWQMAGEMLRAREEAPHLPAILPMFEIEAEIKIGQPLKDLVKNYLPAGSNLYPLQSQLEKGAADLSRFIGQEKEALVKQLENNVYDDNIDEVKKSLFRLFDAPVNFDTLFELYLKKDLQQLKKRGDWTDVEIDRLNEKLYRIEILTQHQQKIQLCLQRLIDLQEIPKGTPAFAAASAAFALDFG